MGKYDELHTCHNECERPACVLRRKVATLEAELAAMREAIEPVMHWYQSDEEDPRPLSDIVAGIVADLQSDRADALKLAAARTMLQATAEAAATHLKRAMSAEAELAAMKARGDRLANFAETVAEFGSDTMKELARQALTEWRDQ